MQTALRFRMGAVQAGACQVYVTDPVHEDEVAGVLSVEGSHLLVWDKNAAWRFLTDASNSADASNDSEFRDALHALSVRVLKAGAV